ncbi:phage tail protein I [Enterobacter sp. MF024]|uniref:phage tail protein I n=1 Tax=Enterobacter sp. MF024 TaxID=2555644 RepID=UPI001105DB27|nr:phage tail protein I [Enterobacter sp. MF024]TLU69597.1 phage tail protein I [Enterobacter sp. MF024]
MNDLLPPSASRIERVAARVCASLGEVPVPLRQLWNPWTCRADLLPYLAWAFSVDRWDELWPTSTKRKAVADAFYLHKYKGTTGAMRRVVEPFGYFICVNEWWNIDTAPGTFTLDIGIEDKGISDETYHELVRLVTDVKPCSRHMLGLRLHLQTVGALNVGASAYLGDTLTVYPYFPETISVGGGEYVGSALHLIDTMEVLPGGN